MSARLAVVGGLATALQQCDAEPAAPQPRVMTNCPDCRAELAILRIIGGRGGAEYWTLRCVSCGGIHLDIIKGAAPVG
jgi:Zn finger protein HypA/HybF involved in hydrogenase expression